MTASRRTEADTTTDLPFRSIADMFLNRVAESPNGRAFGYPAADGTGPAWLTWGQVGERATAIAAGLRDLGVEPEDRVAILSNTRVEWILADLGVLCAGGATTTVYPTTEPEDAAYILGDSGSRILIAENADQVAKIAEADLPELVAIIVMDGTATARVPVHTLAAVEVRGAEKLAGQPDLIAQTVEAIRSDHLATLIYTSGTTGRPKGVELLHAGWVWEGKAQADLDIMRTDDLQYLWLPLSHSFGKTLLCSIIYLGTPTYVDGRVDKIVENLSLVRPTLMCAAPRVFEKVYNKAVTTAREAGGLKWKIFSWAVAVGRRHVVERLAGREPGVLLDAQYALADKLVFHKLRDRLGGNIRALISGSAPLAKEIGEFFHAARLEVLEGYGLTETSAGSFINRPGRARLGTVGQHLGDLECRIDTDGEILLRGMPVMRGYHHLPEESAAAFTEDGYLRTGDIGELDADGYLRITDRKKDLIKTSGGKYVAPTHIEGLFKAVCPYVSQALVIGQARNYCTMLVTLDPDAITVWAAGGPLEGASYERIAAADETREMVSAYVNELNARLNRWETIKKFAILRRDLSVEHGELTPSMKVKRRAVEEAFAAEIDQLYSGSVAAL